MVMCVASCRRCAEAAHKLIRISGEEEVWVGGGDIEALRVLTEDCEGLAMCDQVDKAKVRAALPFPYATPL